MIQDHSPPLRFDTVPAKISVALIVDRDEYFRIAMRHILKDHFGVVSTVETSTFDEAADRLRSAPSLRLALLDLQMPDIDATSAMRSLREMFPNVLVAVVSATDSRSDVLRCLDAGVHGYLQKSMGAAGLAHALHLISCGVVFVPPFIAHGDITLLNRSEENVHRPKHANPIKISRPAVKAITPRQCEVLRLLRQGCTNKTIARELSLSEGAVKFHLAALFRRLGARNRAEAVANGFSYLAQSADTDPQTLHRQ